MANKTAICKDKAGQMVAVECRLWENWHGATDFQNTVAQLRQDHPELTFVAWVVESVEELRGNFLSPQVERVKVWFGDETGVYERSFSRAEVLA